MKTIAIFCGSTEMSWRTRFADHYYWEAYSDLLLLIKQKGAIAYLVSGNNTYVGSGVFTRAYTLTQKGPIDSLVPAQSIKADLVFNRGNFGYNDVPILNSEHVARVGNKITTYDLFGKYQPRSQVCYNMPELRHAIRSMNGDNVVVKTPNGSMGRGVYIASKTILLTIVPTHYPLLVQEFVDSSVGVPGHVSGLHDLRVETGGGKIWGCYIRIPKAGEYRANVAQGGSKLILHHTDVPSEVRKLAYEIDAYFEEYPRFYGIDFMNTSKGWKLIEINSRQLGLVSTVWGPDSTYTLNKLADYLIELCTVDHPVSHASAFAAGV
jgi:hypothetical protein